MKFSLKTLLLFSTCFYSFNTLAQSDNDLSLSEYEDVERMSPAGLRYGSVTFVDGTTFEGQLQFFDESRIAVVDKDGNSNYLGPSEVDQFEFYENAFDNPRKFVTLPYKAYAYSTPQNIFLEVLKESSCCFSVLMKIERPRQQPHDPANQMFRVNTSDPSRFFPGYVPRDRVLGRTNKTVVLMDQTGDLKPYLEITFTESQGVFRDRSGVDNNCLNKKLIRQLTGKHYKTLREYAKKNDISVYTPGGVASLAEQCELLCNGTTDSNKSTHPPLNQKPD